MKTHFPIIICIISYLLFHLDCYSQVSYIHNRIDYSEFIELLNKEVKLVRNNYDISNSDQAEAFSNEIMTNVISHLSSTDEANPENVYYLECSLLSLSILEEFGLTKSLKYAQNLESICAYLTLLGYYDEAITFCKRAADTYGVLPDTQYEYGLALINLGKYRSDLGDIAGALNNYNHALETINAEGGFRSLSDADEYLNNTMRANLLIGNYDNAYNHNELLILLNKYLYGENSIEYSRALSNMGTILQGKGLYYEACSYYKIAISIIQDIPEYQYDLAISSDMLGKALLACRNFTDAKKYILSSIEIFKGLDLHDSYDFAAVLQSLGDYYSCLGEYNTAFIHYSEAHKIIERTCLSSSPEFIISWQYLAMTQRDNGNISEALKLYNQLLTYQYDSYGMNHAFLETLITIAELYIDLEEHQKAHKIIEEGISIANELQHSYSLSSCYHALGNYFFDIGDYSSAIQNYIKSNDIKRESSIDDPAAYFNTLVNLCLSYIYVGNFSESIAIADEINSLYDDILAKLNFMNYKERYQYWPYVGKWAMKCFPFLVSVVQSDKLLCDLYNSQLKYKNLLLTYEVEERKYSENKLSNENEYNSLVTSLGNLSVDLNAFPNDIDSLFRHNSYITKPTNKASSIAGDVNIRSIKRKLSKKDIAIEFIEIPDTNNQNYLYALVLKKSSNAPKLIKICNIYDLPKVHNVTSEPTIKQLAEYKSHYLDLYDCIWKPLEDELKNIANIYFSPSLHLQQVGIEYAFNNDDSSIYDKYNIIRLSTTHQISSYNPIANVSESFLVGGLYMGNIPSHSDYFSNISESTLDEVTSIANILKSDVHSDVIVVSGDNATESSITKFFDQNRNINLVHLSTHGYWWPLGSIQQPISPQINKGFFDNLEDPNLALCRSGVALSNANYAMDALLKGYDNIDGLLMSSEVANLKLHNVDLVTLSACQTGLGDLTPAGIFGLQRGFKLAGVKSIMMSLWSVETNATKLLMIEFYKNLVSGKTYHEALKQAQRKLRNSDIYNNPYYWAAFIMLD